MTTPAISHTDMVEIQLRKWIARGNIHNVTLRPSNSHASVPAGETVVAEIIDRAGRGIFFAGSGFTLPDRGFIYYDDVQSAAWISNRPDRLARKQEDYDHIELTLRNGSSATLRDVDEVVFPLLRFFEWMLAKRKKST